MSFPELCVVDTNVPIVANCAFTPEVGSDVPCECVLACVEAIKYVTTPNRNALVIDNGDEIFGEYRKHLSLRGKPGVGDKFLKWVHDNRWSLPEANRVAIKRKGDTFEEFPDDDGLKGFDKSDKKFVAVACAHPQKPPIWEAVDSDFYQYKSVLKALGVTVLFVSEDCEKYAGKKHAKKTPGAKQKK
jgi:hypothetical protein